MGKKAHSIRKATKRTIRTATLEERRFLRENATYKGVSYHKKTAGDFGLIPPAGPRADKTLCDSEDSGVSNTASAQRLFLSAIEHGLVSDLFAAARFPSRLWAVDERDRVFEARYSGGRPGVYHGFPIRRRDPLFNDVLAAWNPNP
jgi:hypothetical protein